MQRRFWIVFPVGLIVPLAWSQTWCHLRHIGYSIILLGLVSLWAWETAAFLHGGGNLTTGEPRRQPRHRNHRYDFTHFRHLNLTRRDKVSLGTVLCFLVITIKHFLSPLDQCLQKGYQDSTCHIYCTTNSLRNASTLTICDCDNRHALQRPTYNQTVLTHLLSDLLSGVAAASDHDGSSLSMTPNSDLAHFLKHYPFRLGYSFSFDSSIPIYDPLWRDLYLLTMALPEEKELMRLFLKTSHTIDELRFELVHVTRANFDQIKLLIDVIDNLIRQYRWSIHGIIRQVFLPYSPAPEQLRAYRPIFELLYTITKYNIACSDRVALLKQDIQDNIAECERNLADIYTTTPVSKCEAQDVCIGIPAWERLTKQTQKAIGRWDQFVAPPKESASASEQSTCPFASSSWRAFGLRLFWWLHGNNTSSVDSKADSGPKMDLWTETMLNHTLGEPADLSPVIWNEPTLTRFSNLSAIRPATIREVHLKQIAQVLEEFAMIEQLPVVEIVGDPGQQFIKKAQQSLNTRVKI